MDELSIFVDESGSDNMQMTYYLVTLVFHDQDTDLSESIEHYEQALRDKRLPDIPFHASPLLNGHDDYRGMSMETRKRLLSAFRVFFRHLPITYVTFTFEVNNYDSVVQMSNSMRQELVNYLFNNLPMLQKYRVVKIYYDGGQSSVTEALHKAIDYALSKNAIVYRPAIASEYRLSQAADYICTAELTALKYQHNRATATDEKFFGSWNRFKKGVLKEVQSKHA